MTERMICAGCNREIEVGDRYIEDTASGYTKSEADTEIDGLVADILGGTLLGGGDGKVRYCEDCTTPGGDYFFETNYGEDES